MNILLLPGACSIADTYVNEMPNAEETAEIALMAADEIAVSASRRRWPCCPLQLRQRPQHLVLKMRAAHPARLKAPICSATARCTVIRPCRRRSATAASGLDPPRRG